MWSLLLLPAAQAGDPGPLCEAVAQASVIAELGFTATGEYPSAYKRKHWEPPEEAILPTVATARVLRVLKGDATGWVPELDDLDFGNQSTTWWERFFSAGEFQALVMLQGTAPDLGASGWLADDGSCHVSWCWEAHRAAVLACLEAQGIAPPPPPAPPPVAAAPTPPAAPAPAPPAPAPAPAPAPDESWFKGCSGG